MTSRPASARPEPTIADITQHREVILASTPTDNSFSIVTYNILADCHMEPHWYSYTPADARTSEQRHPRLMAELGMLAPDILCLQEVGEDYLHLLSSDLGERGYAGQFYQKTLGTREGLVTFYKKTEFDCLAVEKISFNEMLADAVEAEGLERSVAGECERDQVFLVMRLKHVQTDMVVTVGNIHTIWENFSQPDVTALQVSLALAKLAKIADGGPFIIAGDFNSRPHMPAYALLARGGLADDHRQELAEAATATVEGKTLFELLEKHYSHTVTDLASSYRMVKGEEPGMTSYDDYDGHHPSNFCLDYIWYTQDMLEANCVLDTTIKPSSRIPNNVFPSDHLSLKSTFSFIVHTSCY